MHWPSPDIINTAEVMQMDGRTDGRTDAGQHVSSHREHWSPWLSVTYRRSFMTHRSHQLCWHTPLAIAVTICDKFAQNFEHASTLCSAVTWLSLTQWEQTIVRSTASSRQTRDTPQLIIKLKFMTIKKLLMVTHYFAPQSMTVLMVIFIHQK